ncbi:prepilin-type N-terminal cleavage/methylation domain-containing protein [Stieleria varia]|uniref:Uncharacterized protein n=1 Tax=Stieleria varia TaxID=2528005 RepID=A0A5C6B6G7_9BACT|nr:prepilin-type N-terminal cleavage/methylation domain-containing protein [Stieleria varia]TWU07538.1 hypothetical protein Pla52n_01110 [Stieleria varia]
MRSTLGRERAGFTFIELIAAMAAASVLMVSLLATVLIATSLLQPNTSAQQETRDRSIEDRISSDLRYATAIDSSPSYGFNVTRASVTTGSSESLSYESYIDGLTRGVNGDASVTLDIAAPSHQSHVDGYSAPTSASQAYYPRVRAVNSVASPGTVGSLSCPLPNGVKDGDLLLLVTTYRSAPFVLISPGGWNFINFAYRDGMVIDARYTYYNSSMPPDVTAFFFFDTGEIGISIYAIENAHPYSPILGSVSSSGEAYAGNSLSHPAALQSGTHAEGDLNLQLIIADESPIASSTLGMPGFTDVIRRTVAPYSSKRFSSGSATRNGPISTTFAPRVWFQQDAPWAMLSVRIGGPDA